MILKEKYTKQEAESFNKKIYLPGEKLQKNRKLVPYHICKELGLLNNFTKPSAFILIEYPDMEYGIFTLISFYEPLFNIGKFNKFIKDTEEGDYGFATEVEIMGINDQLSNLAYKNGQLTSSDESIEEEDCQAIGYTYNNSMWDEEYQQYEEPGWEDYMNYELVYDIRSEPAFKKYLQQTVSDFQEWLDDPSYYDQEDKELKEILRGIQIGN
jgi:hypothetical protein